MLNDANDRAEELLEAVAVKDRAPVTEREAGERRRRAFSIFARAYRDAQRAVAYLRPDEDEAEELAPSIFTKKASRRRGEAEEGSSAEAGEGSTEGSSGRAAAPGGNGSPGINIDPNGLPITPPLVG